MFNSGVTQISAQPRQLGRAQQSGWRHFGKAMRKAKSAGITRPGVCQPFCRSTSTGREVLEYCKSRAQGTLCAHRTWAQHGHDVQLQLAFIFALDNNTIQVP